MQDHLIEFSEILAFIKSNDVLIKSDAVKISGFRPVSTAGQGDLTFVSDETEKGVQQVSSSRASVIICSLKLKDVLRDCHSNLIFVDKPRLWFIRTVNEFTQRAIPRPKGIHRTAIVESQILAVDVYIGPYVYIGKNVHIGEGSVIRGGVHIYCDTKIGRNVTIESGTVLGTDGFGFERDQDMELEKFPHLGGIIIEDEVEIGSNVSIDRGTLEDTVIGSGTKIDNLVHIAHNVRIGRNCLIVAGTVLGGSSVIGNNCFIGIGAGVKQKVKIGENVVVGMGSVVLSDIADNLTVAGIPARPLPKKQGTSALEPN